MQPVKNCAITRAVFIGINYINDPANKLNGAFSHRLARECKFSAGCINDAKNSLAMLQSLGFEAKEEANYIVRTFFVT